MNRFVLQRGRIRSSSARDDDGAGQRPGAAVAAGDGDRVVEQPHQQVRARRLAPVALRGIVFEFAGDQPAEVLQQRPVVDRVRPVAADITSSRDPGIWLTALWAAAGLPDGV